MGLIERVNEFRIARLDRKIARTKKKIADYLFDLPVINSAWPPEPFTDYERWRNRKNTKDLLRYEQKRDSLANSSKN